MNSRKMNIYIFISYFRRTIVEELKINFRISARLRTVAELQRFARLHVKLRYYLNKNYKRFWVPNLLQETREYENQPAYPDCGP